MEEALEARPLTELLETVLKPISDDKPAGEDVTYEDIFQNLKGEINKIGSATGEADYDQIIALGTEILAEHSKDLNAVCYLGIGLSRTRKWEGVAEAFAAARHLVETFWEDLYPLKRRMAARRNALQFLVERLGEWMELNRPGPPDREALVWAADEIEALQGFAMEHMGDQAPAFSLVLRLLRDNLRRLPDPAKQTPPAEAAAPAADGAPSGDGAPPASPPPPVTRTAPGPVEIKNADDAARQVYQIAGALREANAYDPAAFRLVRVMRFGILNKLPPNDGGKTLVEPPPKPRRTALAGMLEQGEHAKMVAQGEAALLEPGMHFWLDLQRLVAGGLAGLGAPAQAAHQAVIDEAAALMRRVPGLARLTFADGTPFADPVTADWLAEIASAGGGGGGEPGERDEALEADLDEAKKLAAGGDVAGAIRKLDASGAPRKVFQRRLAAADLCFKAGRADVARPMLEALDALGERHQLAEWEPHLAVAALRLLHRCYEALEAKAAAADKPPLRQEAERVFSRICRLDPAAALA